MIKFLFLIPAVIAAIIISLSIYLQPNDFLGCQPMPISDKPCNPADVIVVVSGGDTAARTQAGIDLYKNGWAPALLFSGAAQDKTGPSNAAEMRQIALGQGVPSGDIFIDELAETTQENAINIQTIMQRQNFRDVILVTSGYHQRRASLELHSQVSDVTIRNAPLAKDRQWSWWWWTTPHGWGLAISEFVKIIVFHIRGGM